MTPTGQLATETAGREHPTRLFRLTVVSGPRPADNPLRVFGAHSGCRDDPALRSQVVRRALRELAGWRGRYGDLFAFLREERLARVARAIDRSKPEAAG